MKYLSVFAAAAIAATGWADVAVAQSSPNAVPAEFPPSSFNGRQYVDSQGCVFIRAGIDSNVTWVPRLTRSRQQVCGFQPSLSASALASVNAPRVAAPEPSTTEAAATTAQPAPAPAAAPAPAPAPRAAATPAPAPKPTPAAAPVPAEPTPAPAPAKTARVETPTVCSNRSRIAQRLMVSKRGEVRCGPQNLPHVTLKDGPPSPDATYYTYRGNPRGHTTATTTATATATATAMAGGEVRIAPKHVYESQLASTEGVFVPEGYEPVWDDDRLNTKRAHQTFAGKAEMERIWTKRTPRTLKPGVFATQSITEGSHVNYAAGGVIDADQTVSRASTLPSSSTLTADTARASHRFVQIGAFTTEEKAKRAAQRLASSGLPTQMAPYRQGGKSYTLLVVGPYKTQGALDGGLAKVRSLGYQSATLKR